MLGFAKEGRLKQKKHGQTKDGQANPTNTNQSGQAKALEKDGQSKAANIQEPTKEPAPKPTPPPTKEPIKPASKPAQRAMQTQALN